MKIVVISQYNPFVDSNAQNNRFLTITEGLLEHGVKIKIIITEGYKSNKEKNLFKKQGKYKGFEFFYTNYFNHKNKFSRRLARFIISTQKNSKRILKEIQTKHKVNYIWYLMSPNMLDIFKTLYYKTSHIKILHERSEYSWINMHNKNLHKYYLNTFLSHVDIFIAMTKTLKQYYLPYLKKDIIVLHLPMTVDLNRFQKSELDNKFRKPYIAYCGTMNNKKDGVDILIKAFAKLKPIYPELQLLLAGPTIPIEDYNNQLKFIKINNISDSVVYLGNLDREEIPSFLSNAKILAMARPNSKQSEGGFPTKLGEYLATGKPVCVTSVGEITDYLINNESAFIAKPDSIQSFLKILKEALESDQYENIGKKGRLIAEKYFNKEIQANKLFNILEKHK